MDYGLRSMSRQRWIPVFCCCEIFADFSLVQKIQTVGAGRIGCLTARRMPLSCWHHTLTVTYNNTIGCQLECSYLSHWKGIWQDRIDVCRCRIPGDRSLAEAITEIRPRLLMILKCSMLRSAYTRLGHLVVGRLLRETSDNTHILVGFDSTTWRFAVQCSNHSKYHYTIGAPSMILM